MNRNSEELELVIVLGEYEVEIMKQEMKIGNVCQELEPIIENLLDQIESPESDAELCMNQLLASNQSLNSQVGALKRTVKQLKKKLKMNEQTT